MKWCWHKWDVFKDIREVSGNSIFKIKHTKKICRKCGEKRIKETIV